MQKWFALLNSKTSAGIPAQNFRMCASPCASIILFYRKIFIPLIIFKQLKTIDFMFDSSKHHHNHTHK